MTQTQMFDVQWADVDAQLHKVELANRKAARAGLPGYTADVVGTYTERIATDQAVAGRPVYRYTERAIIEVYGEAPKVGSVCRTPSGLSVAARASSSRSR